MNFLFWLIWVVNILVLCLAVLGKGFRSGIGAGTDLNVLVILVLIVILLGSLILRFAIKQKGISLVVVSLPLLAMVLLYLIEKTTGRSI